MKISVCVITYNQKKYIRKCLEGITKQVFPDGFEVVIRDDMSNDGTLDEIKEFIATQDNPNIVFNLIDSNINLGPNKNLFKVMNSAKGDFLAFCEGDDYWCDDYKLAKQYKESCQNNNCDFFVHPSYYEYNDGKIEKKTWPIIDRANPTVDDIFKSSWQFAPTSSYFIRKKVIDDLPDWIKEATIADIYIEFYASLNGIIVNQEYMSVYRFEAEGSWSKKMKSKNLLAMKKAMAHYENFNLCLERIKNDYPQFDKSIYVKLSNNYFQLAVLYLGSKDFTKFRQFIDLWKANSTNASIIRSFFYMFKNYNNLSLLLYKLKRRV